MTGMYCIYTRINVCEQLEDRVALFRVGDHVTLVYENIVSQQMVFAIFFRLFFKILFIFI